MIDLKRAFDPPSPDDGIRVLVDRIWPRGISKDRLQLDRWERDVAPSTELRKWFGHDPRRWLEFRERYRQELLQASQQAALKRLEDEARHHQLTLVYSARDTEHNQAIVLKEVLLERLQSGPAGNDGPGGGDR